MQLCSITSVLPAKNGDKWRQMNIANTMNRGQPSGPALKGSKAPLQCRPELLILLVNSVPMHCIRQENHDVRGEGYNTL